MQLISLSVVALTGCAASNDAVTAEWVYELHEASELWVSESCRCDGASEVSEEDRAACVGGRASLRVCLREAHRRLQEDPRLEERAACLIALRQEQLEECRPAAEAGLCNRCLFDVLDRHTGCPHSGRDLPAEYIELADECERRWERGE